MIIYILSGIQYLHECERAAKDHPNDDLDTASHNHRRTHQNLDDEYKIGEDGGTPWSEDVHMEEGLEILVVSLVPWAEENPRCHAVETVKWAKIFANDQSQWSVNANGQQTVINATGSALQWLMQ